MCFWLIGWVSSGKYWTLQNFIAWFRSFIYDKNSMGPRTDPWGTTQFMAARPDISFSSIFSISPRNYRRQKAIVFDIAIKEKIICSKFLPPIIYLQFAMNLSLFCWIQMFTLLRKHSSPDYFTWSISFPFILDFITLRWSEQYCQF